MDYPSWTYERVETLKRLWRDGLSSSQIAVQLGGISRSAVLGKVHRLGLAGRAVASRKEYHRRHPWRSRTTAPKPRKRTQGVILKELAALPLPQEQPADIGRVSLMDLEPHHCRFVAGDPKGVASGTPVYCGAQKVPGLAYCEHHARRCYEAPQVKPRKREFVLPALARARKPEPV